MPYIKHVLPIFLSPGGGELCEVLDIDLELPYIGDVV